MMSSRKIVAAVLVAVQMLLPGSGICRSMAGIARGSVGVTAPVTLPVGANMLLKSGLNLQTPMSSSLVLGSVAPAPTPALAPVSVVAAHAAVASPAAGLVNGAVVGAAVNGKVSAETAIQSGRAQFDLTGSYGAAALASEPMVAPAFRGGAQSLAAASVSDVKGGTNVPAPKAPSKFKVSTLVDAVVGLFVYHGYKFVVLPTAMVLGTVAFTLGVDVPANMPHYIVSIPGYLSQGTSMVLGYAAPMAEQVATGLSNFAGSNGTLAYVYGTLASAGGHIAGFASSAMSSMVQPLSTFGQYLVNTVAPAVTINTKPLMDMIPTEWWWFGPATVANYRMAKANGWKLVGGPAQTWVESKTGVPGVSFLGWMTDAILVNPALFMRDIGRDVIYPVIRPVWETIKDAWQFVYDYPLTWIGHGLRGVGVGAITTVTSAAVAPFIMTSSFLMNYVITPTYRALRTVTRTKTGTAILVGGVALTALGGFFGVYSLATLAANVMGSVPYITTAILAAWWLEATVTGAIGFGVGAYNGVKTPFVDAVKQSYDKVIGTTQNWLKKAWETFKQAHQDTK